MSAKTLKTDVLVCGGGCAGIAASLSAARSGAKTLLVERAGFAGGILTTVGLPYFDGLIDKRSGRFVVKGIALELLRGLGVAKANAKHIDDLPAELTTKFWMSVRVPNIEAVKCLADHLILEEQDNLRVLFHSTACDVEVKEGRVVAVRIANKDGLVRVEAAQVIDCTGDADIATWAGCPVESKTTLPLMPMTMHFRIGNVKPNKEASAAAKQVLIDAHKRGELPEFYGPGLMFAFAPDEVYVHATRIPGDATDAADFSRAEMQGRKDAMTIFKLWKAKVPGFEESYYIESGPYLGVRDTRRIVGESVLTTDDLKQSTRYADAIATGCWFLDIHPPTTTTDKPFAGEGFQPAPYDISYRTMVPRKVSNLLVAGRCHSATQEAAASSRVTVTAMALGEAAGCAAALAVRGKTDVGVFDGVKVREALGKQGGGPSPMNEVTPGGKGGLPTRREFGRLLAAAAVLPAALPLLGEASPVAPPTGDYVPEDTYPYFTESDPAHLTDQRHAEPGAAADRRGMLAFSDISAPPTTELSRSARDESEVKRQ